MKENQFNHKDFPEALAPGDFWTPSKEICSYLKQNSFFSTQICTVFRNKLPSNADIPQSDSPQLLILFWETQDSPFIHRIISEPELFEQNWLALGNSIIYQGPLTDKLLFKPLKLSNVPTLCLQSLLVTEDENFLNHSGIDPKGLARAFWVNLQKRRFAQGGSTLTQQYVKNAFLTQDKTLKRKALEILLSFWIEARNTKDEILEKYLNVVYFGSVSGFEIRGLEAASRFYFEKSVDKLTLSECTSLSAMLKGPAQYDPFKKVEALKQRRVWILSRLKEAQLISDEEEKKAVELTTLRQTNPTQGSLGYFLSSLSESNTSPTQSHFFSGIQSSLQNKLAQTAQTYMEEIDTQYNSLKEQKKKNNPAQVSFVLISRITGDIAALVGGRDYSQAPYPRATKGRRPIGSLIKPFIFYLNFKENKNQNLNTFIEDSPLEIKIGNQVWRPENYDKKWRGSITLNEALAKSLNSSAVKLGLEIGLSPLVEWLTLALPDWTPPTTLHPSLLLGSLELTPLEVAQLYYHFDKPFNPLPQLTRELFLKNELTDPEPHLDPSKEQIFTILKNAKEIGTSQALKTLPIEWETFGKTGTTSDYRDAWFAGYSQHWVLVTWIGFDNNQSLGLSGSQLALPLWKRLIEQAENNHP